MKFKEFTLSYERDSYNGYYTNYEFDKKVRLLFFTLIFFYKLRNFKMENLLEGILIYGFTPIIALITPGLFVVDLFLMPFKLLWSVNLK